MNKEFITYEQALALKELGFNEPCFGYFEPNKKFKYLNWEILKDFPYLAKNSEWQDLYGAPTFSQAFRWFREKHNLVIQYIPHEIYDDNGQSNLHHKYKISEYDSWRGGRRNTVETELNETYEEAEFECIEKLIEIIQNERDINQ